jgi:diguanylate cyclase (GGDEF)-like protein/PAS domain S-box-containing protein
MASSPPPTAVVASSRVGVLRVDAVGSVTTAAGAALALLGRDPNESIAGMPIMNALHPDDHEVGIVNWVAAKEQRGVAHRWRCRIVRADGSPLAVEVTMTNNIDTTGNGEVVVELYDISQEVAVTEALAEEKALLGLLTETLPVGVAKFDANGEIEHVNGRLWQLLAPDEPHDVFVRAIRGELEVRELSAVFRRVLDDGVGGRVVVEHAGGEHGEPVHLEWTLRPVVSDMGEVTGGVVCVADITEATNLRAALEHRARTDALTGCLNRAGTLAAIDHALVGAALEGVGLLFIDLDGFKHVNDAQGHAVGDAVLEIVASRLRGAVRDGDLVGRLGGDEFVVIAPRLHSASAALGLAHRVAEQLHGVATIGACTVDIAASIGVAWSRAASAGGLLADADAAMYAAKQTRSGRPVLAAC